MAAKPDDKSEDETKTDWAANRTDWAEDRTLMANERTFAGWMRTGLAAVGIGIGFNALFGQLEPQWLARVLATMFILVGIGIFHAARLNACKTLARMSAHKAEPVARTHMARIAYAFQFASALLIVGIWWIALS